MTATRTARITAVLISLVIVAAGCQADSSGSDSTSDTISLPASDSAIDSAGDATPVSEPPAVSVDDAEARLRVALVAPSSRGDTAWTQAMVESLDRVAQGRAIDLAVSDNLVVVEDAVAAIRGYAEDGVDLVLAHGTQYVGPVAEIAPEYPDVSFMIGTSADDLDLANVFSYFADAGAAGYVNGLIAARLTTTNRVGVVGPVPAGDAQLYVDGFVAGVAAVEPTIEVDVIYIDSFSDVLLASEAARALVTAGADVLTGSAQMVVGAIGVAAELGIPWLGLQSDQRRLGDVVVASVVYRWDGLLSGVLDEIEAGRLGGEARQISVADGGLELVFNDAFPLASDVRAGAEAAMIGIGDGSITVPLSE